MRMRQLFVYDGRSDKNIFIHIYIGRGGAVITVSVTVAGSNPTSENELFNILISSLW